MNKKAISALRKSIAHWRRLANGKQETCEDPGEDCCALCIAFKHEAVACKSCPVQIKTGQPFCRGTPHREAANAYYDLKCYLDPGIDREYYLKLFKDAAKKEVEFLESLLPKTK
jgi:inosine-uridine nucleoside N-ribohydrolase